jgi:hypothetical protein
MMAPARRTYDTTGTGYDWYGNKQDDDDVYVEGDDDDNTTFFVCEPNYVFGDNPRADGCSHAPVPNPFIPNAIEAEKDQVPAPCHDYQRTSADSGCFLPWNVGCIERYMTMSNADPSV